LVGKGPELKTAVQTAEREGADRELIILGNLESVNEIISAADLLLLPSETESFGMAALEAMACGVPPIATDTGGLPEVVEDGVTGFLLPVGDVEGMTRRALDLLMNEEKRREIGCRAREAARERFSIDKALDAYEKLYQDTLKTSDHS